MIKDKKESFMLIFWIRRAKEISQLRVQYVLCSLLSGELTSLVQTETDKAPHLARYRHSNLVVIIYKQTEHRKCEKLQMP